VGPLAEALESVYANIIEQGSLPPPVDWHPAEDWGDPPCRSGPCSGSRCAWNPRETRQPAIPRPAGAGVAAASYVAVRQPSQATAGADPGGTFTIKIAAADIGTGARTVLTQIAAGTLGVELERVHAEIGDSALPPASPAIGSTGTASWSSAVVDACRQLRDELGKRDGAVPPGGLDVRWINEEDPNIGPAGAKGIGEIGIVGAAAAIANAVYHATGIRVRDLPIRIDRLIDAAQLPGEVRGRSSARERSG